MAAAGIFSHAMTAMQALKGTPADTSASGSSGTSNSNDASSSSATISANDFLTLLVTEMQNQDPTADTDPNEYINQLVQVNSLEQLIDINQTLATGLDDSSSGAGNGASPHEVGASPDAPGANGASSTILQGISPASAGALPPIVSASKLRNTAAAQQAPGNLGLPAATAAAHRVAHALDGRVRAQPAEIVTAAH